MLDEKLSKNRESFPKTEKRITRGSFVVVVLTTKQIYKKIQNTTRNARRKTVVERKKRFRRERNHRGEKETIVERKKLLWRDGENTKRCGEKETVAERI